MPIVFLTKIITKQFFHGNAGTSERVILFTAWSRSNDEVAQRKDRPKVLPGADVAKRVQADDEVERVALAQLDGKFPDRINRIRQTRAFQFDGRDGKTRVTCYRQSH